MLLDLEQLVKKYELEIDAVAHVGAHYGQESVIYDKLNIGLESRYYFEPQPEVYKILCEREQGRGKFYNYALGDQTGEIEMYVERDNQSMSSSCLPPGTHLFQYPHIRFTDKITVPIIRLNDLFIEEEFSNKKWLVSADVQGYEIQVLKGATKILPYTNALLLEVNRGEVYKGCAQVEEIDDFLNNYGFTRVETNWEGISWGDALFIRK